ncbi:MAG: TonB-dependent receptor [Prolixibacteraceae bacterium]
MKKMLFNDFPLQESRKQLWRMMKLSILFSLCCSLMVVANSTSQAGSISGKVTDSSGLPIPGVSVLIKGTNSGTTTGTEGKYSLDNVSPSAKLLFSFIGMKTQEVSIGGRTTINVILEEETVGIEEVVAIGYGTLKKRDVTGSVSSVKEKVIMATPTANVATAMQGRVAGLDVNGTTLRIRGNRSINGSNNPLVIIDGVQGGSLSDLNPADVESIDVLKDASSTAIYGSQGANGVIIVTTKKAQPGKMAISYNGFTGLDMMAAHPEYRSGENWLEPQKIAAQNAKLWTPSSDLTLLLGTNETYNAYMANQWTNYDNELMQNALFHNHQITAMGGNDKTTARFSISYYGTETSFKKGSNERFNFRSNIDHRIREWIHVGINTQITYNSVKTSPYAGTATTGMQLGVPYDANGILVTYPLGATGYANPLIDGTTDYFYNKKSYGTNIVANGYLDVKPLKGLTLRSQFSTSIQNNTSGSYVDNDASTQINTTKKTTASMSKTDRRYVEWNNIATYNKKIGNHCFTLTGLTSWTKGISDVMTGTSYDQLISTNLWYNLTSGINPNIVSGYTQTQTYSYAGRLNYDFKGKYLFTASVRRDGASVLAEGHKWANFPSAALAWRVSDESFMKSTKSWLDDLKFRATYGVTGNSGINAYGTQSGVSAASTGLAFQDVAVGRYLYNNTIGNTDTKWEKSATTDLGLDMTLFKGRVNAVVDVYDTKTSDILLFRTLPTSSGNDGLFGIYQNIGATNNRGVEISLNTVNVKTKDFQWNSTITFSSNKEKIVSLIEDKNIQIGNTKETSTLMIGKPINSIQSFVYEGIWKTAEASQAAILFKDAKKANSFKPGDIHVLDLDGDSIIDENKDIRYLGSPTPKWFAGFNNDFVYKNFDLSIYAYFRWGQWGSNPAAGYDPSNGGQYTSFDYWVANTNENGNLPALYRNRKFYEYNGYQSLSYVDQSFFKIKTLTLGYSLPAHILKAAKIEKVRFYVSLSNPFYVAKSNWMKGFDPEGTNQSYVLGLNINL